MPLRMNPTLMSFADLEAAIEEEMSANPDGSPYADLLHEEFERQTAGPKIEVPNDYPAAS